MFVLTSRTPSWRHRRHAALPSKKGRELRGAYSSFGFGFVFGFFALFVVTSSTTQWRFAPRATLTCNKSGSCGAPGMAFPTAGRGRAVGRGGGLNRFAILVALGEICACVRRGVRFLRLLLSFSVLYRPHRCVDIVVRYCLLVFLRNVPCFVLYPSLRYVLRKLMRLFVSGRHARCAAFCNPRFDLPRFILVIAAACCFGSFIDGSVFMWLSFAGFPVPL